MGRNGGEAGRAEHRAANVTERCAPVAVRWDVLSTGPRTPLCAVHRSEKDASVHSAQLLAAERSWAGRGRGCGPTAGRARAREERGAELPRGKIGRAHV